MTINYPNIRFLRELELNIYLYLIDTLVLVILLELLNLPVRIRESPRDVPPSVSDMRFNNKHIVKCELLSTRAQLFHVLRHRSMLGLRPGGRFWLCRGCVVRRILIYIAYIARPWANLHSVRIDDVVIYDVRALR